MASAAMVVPALPFAAADLLEATPRPFEGERDEERHLRRPGIVQTHQGRRQTVHP